MKTLISLCVLLLAALVSAVSSSGSRLLVVLDDLADKASYSKFFADLERRSYQITYETPKSESLHLFHLGERTYDHIVFLPTKIKGLGPNLTPNILLDFVAAEGNILLALSSTVPTPSSLVSLLLELDIQLPSDRVGVVVDHFNYDTISAAEQHDVLALEEPSPVRPDIKDFFSPEGVRTAEHKLLAFPHGMGVLLGSGPLLTPILRAPSTAYSYNPKEQGEAIDDLFGAGSQLSLVAAMQGRNSARFTVVGSAEMLQDKWFDVKVQKAGSKVKSPVVNEDFAKQLSAWTFKELGVLKVNWIEHHLNEVGAANNSNPKIYRIKNDVTYTISLSEYVWDKWTAFTVPPNDVLQLEFSMLSPFHRLQLLPDVAQSTPESAAYSASFKLPDQHGIFNFKVNYKRPFFSNIEEKNTVSVRHMAHDEWPRSYVINGAWPWISGIATSTVAFVAFAAIFLFGKPTSKATVAKKTQ